MIDSKLFAEYAKHPQLALQNLSHLLALLESEDETELNFATDLLENCGAPSLSDIPFLCGQLKSGRSSQVYWCCTLLGRIGPTVGDRKKLDSIQTELCFVVNNESLELSARERAAWAIGELGALDSSCRTVLEMQFEKAPSRLKRLLESALAT